MDCGVWYVWFAGGGGQHGMAGARMNQALPTINLDTIAQKIAKGRESTTHRGGDRHHTQRQCMVQTEVCQETCPRWLVSSSTA